MQKMTSEMPLVGQAVCSFDVNEKIPSTKNDNRDEPR